MTRCDMEKVLKQLVERLTKAYGERLVSVVLYGSAAVGDHHGRFSDLNILCVLREVTPRELGESAGIFHWWRKLGNPSPLLFGLEELLGRYHVSVVPGILTRIRCLSNGLHPFFGRLRLADEKSAAFLGVSAPSVFAYLIEKRRRDGKNARSRRPGIAAFRFDSSGQAAGRPSRMFRRRVADPSENTLPLRCPTRGL